MTANGIIQITFYFAVLAAVAVPLGVTWPGFMPGSRSSSAGLPPRWKDGSNEAAGSTGMRKWDGKSYAGGCCFSTLQAAWPFICYSGHRDFCLSIPMDWQPSPPDLAINTAVSFVTNTNWQAYSGK